MNLKRRTVEGNQVVGGPDVVFNVQHPQLPARVIGFAEYKVVPPDTRSLPARLKGLSWRYVGACAAIASVVTVLLIGCVYWHFLTFVVQLGKFVIPALGLCWAWAKFHIAPDAIRRMMDVPPVQTQFPVQVTCKTQGNKMVSRDEGIVTFFDGRLLFEGRRFSFDLDTEVVGKGIERLIRILDREQNKRPSPIEITWEANGVSGTIHIAVYDQVPGIGGDFQKSFRSALQTWCLGPGFAKGRFSVPPLLPDANLIAQFKRQRDWSLAATLAAGLLDLFIFLAVSRTPFVAYSGIVAVLILLVLSWRWDNLVKQMLQIDQERRRTV